MVANVTHMRSEITQIPCAVDKLLTDGDANIALAAELIRQNDIRYLMSVARGSSDHACSYLKYVSELLLGLPMNSVGPSLASIYNVTLKFDHALCLAVSQSGQSPDIVKLVQSLGAGGAVTIAITNDKSSELANAADKVLAMHAGAEVSVAATKTFVTSMVAGVWLLASLKQDKTLLGAIRALPEVLERALQCDWNQAAQSIGNQSAGYNAISSATPSPPVFVYPVYVYTGARPDLISIQ